MKQRTAIVGAGIAGLSAARQLVSDDSEVFLFDKGREPGGRCSTRRGQTFTFDHGAQYFTVRDPNFRATIKHLEQDGIVRRWNPVIKRFGTSSNDTPSRIERWIGVPGMSALGKALAFGLDIQTECKVTKVSHANGRWMLNADDLQLGEFDSLIVTSPVDQTRQLLGSYVPQRWRLEQVVMEPCWAVMAGFAQSLNLDFEAAFVNGGPISWLCGNRARPGRRRPGGWVIHSTAEWALGHLEEPPDEIAMELLRIFFDLIEKDYVEPEILHAHRWRYAKPNPALDCGFLWDDELALGVTGDWCNGARIEGAFLSGFQLAEKIRGSRLVNT